MRLINADSLKEHYSFWNKSEGSMKEYAEIFDWIVDVQPTIDPVKHGKWENENMDDQVVARCSACNIWNTMRTPYCPHCGAMMDGENNEID